MRLHRSTVVLLLPAILSLAATAASQDLRTAEYYRRLAGVSPRDPRGHYELSLWCSEAGLAAEARALLERTIRIDPDHAAARAALGYRRHGLGWTLGGGASGGAGAGGDGGPATDSGSPAGEPSTGAAEVPAPEGPSTGEGTTTAGDGASGVESPASRLEGKRAFAKEAEELLKTPFNTKEDADFLLHTTHDISSPQFRRLTALLKLLKKNIQTVIGSSRGPIWPDKVQLFFLRAASECVQFSEIVDGQRFPERDGWYTKDEHAVFYEPDGEHLGRLLGETALDFLGGSDRFINWWLRIGIGEYIASQTDEGRERDLYREAFLLTGSMLEGNLTAFHISDLLELPGMGNDEAERRAQALTLIDYLLRAGRSKLGRLIADLKSDAAPPLPADPSNSEEFRRFFIDHIAFQEEAVRKSFADLEKLDQKWKEYVLDRAKTLGRQAPGGQGQGPGQGAGPGQGRTGGRKGGQRQP